REGRGTRVSPEGWQRWGTRRECHGRQNIRKRSVCPRFTQTTLALLPAFRLCAPRPQSSSGGGDGLLLSVSKPADFRFGQISAKRAIQFDDFGIIFQTPCCLGFPSHVAQANLLFKFRPSSRSCPQRLGESISVSLQEGHSIFLDQTSELRYK